MKEFAVTESTGGTVLRHHTVSANSPREAAMIIADASDVYIGDGQGHTGMDDLPGREWATKSGQKRVEYRYGVSGYLPRNALDGKGVLTEFVLTVEEKHGPGRPEGSVKPEGRKKTHGITVSEQAWAKAEATGNASAYIERLILADKG